MNDKQERDARILEHIVSYCEQIQDSVNYFGADKDLFLENSSFHNAVALCILQIGELVGNLSDEYRTAHPEIAWREIKMMRNIVAHRYGTVDHSITWDVVVSDIPTLKDFCEKELTTHF